MLALLILSLSQQIPAEPVSPPPEKKLCRRVMTTGTMMPNKRVCHSAGEWTQIDAATKAATDQALEQRRNLSGR